MRPEIKRLGYPEGFPKQLLPLGNGQSPTTRIATQMQHVCDTLYCGILPEAEPFFREAFEKIDIPVILIERRPGITKEFGDLIEMERIMRIDNADWVCQANGDLVAESNVLDAFWTDIGSTSKLGRDKKDGGLRAASISIDQFGILAQWPFKPRRTLLRAALWQIRGKLQREHLPILFNVDTPGELARAQAHFSSPENVLLTPDNPHQ